MGACLHFVGALALAAAAVPLVWLAVHSLRAAWRSLLLLRAVTRARSRRLAELRPGPVALLGEAVAVEPLVSEETGRKSV